MAGTKPTLLELLKFTRTDGRMINIAVEISTKYHQFGTVLLDDRTGSKVRSLEYEHHYNVERINTAILREWLTGRGKEPVNWATLVEVLRDIELSALAEEIETVKCSASYPSSLPTFSSTTTELGAAHPRIGRQMDSEDEDVPKHKRPKLEQAELQRALKPYTVKAKPTGKELGSGTYGRVIELISAGEIVAGKVFKISSNVHPQTLTNKLVVELSLMTQVHHPNVVQCKGVCLLESEAMPVLLMERLMSSLHAYVLDSTNSNMSLVRKLSILYDVASGLNYLHSHKPAIIHRDLTGTNVLLDEELRAKISDFVNARIMDLDPKATPGIFISLPGTPDYVPPEAQGNSAKCGPSLDVFSFGHLSLFTIIQSLVHPLLPSTYIDAGEVCARSEVKRRREYLDKAEQLLKGNPSVVTLIKQCLHNDSAQRPQTAELQRRLKDMLMNVTSPSQSTISTGEQPTRIQGSLQGVEVIAVTEFTVSAQVTEFEWEGYGLRLHVPEGSLPGGMANCRVNIRASLSGKFQLPEDTILLSPVFWISAPSKSKKPVTLEIQHWALREDEKVLSDLSFVSAKDSQKELPYSFKQLDGGVFTMQSAYGSIQLSHFCGIGIIGRMWTPQSYCAHVYHALKHMYDWRFYLAITKDHPTPNQAVMKYFGPTANFDDLLIVEFQKNEITLAISNVEELNQKGWKITPISSPAIITKTDADMFPHKRQCIPKCELMMEWMKQCEAPTRLQLEIILNGARRPKSLQLVLDPEKVNANSSSQTNTSTGERSTQVTSDEYTGLCYEPKMIDLMNEIAVKLPGKWQDIGRGLGLEEYELNKIKLEKQTINDIFSSVFTQWYNGKKSPYTWEQVLKVLYQPAVGGDRVADELKEKYRVS